MSLNARTTQWDARLYNVNRDVAHCFGPVMQEVAARLEDGRWTALSALLKEKNVSMDDLGKACKAACLFTQSATLNKKEKMGAALARSGWWDVPELANIALCAMLGTVMFGLFWTGAHETTIGGDGPCQSMQDLCAAGAKAHKLITMPRWRRWLYKARIRLGNIWNAILGGLLTSVYAGEERHDRTSMAGLVSATLRRWLA